MLLVGDDMGVVHALCFDDSSSWPFRPSFRSHAQYELLNSSSIVRYAMKVHTDWVTKVIWLPVLKCCVSSSLDGSLALFDIVGGSHRSRPFTEHRHSVYDFV